jgi:hypothetical protein
MRSRTTGAKASSLPAKSDAVGNNDTAAAGKTVPTMPIEQPRKNDSGNHTENGEA